MPENAAAEGGFGRDAPSRPDENDRGGAREDKEKAEKAQSFERTMDNANRPDRAPAAPTAAVATANDDHDDDRDDDDRPGLLDRAGDVISGLAGDLQDIARSNPRVDSHGDPVGLIDADGLQRGAVASRVMASGTKAEALANGLGFSSYTEMSARQTTDFIEAKYHEDLAQRAIEEALNQRYGHPSITPVLDLPELQPAPAAAPPYLELGYIPASQPANMGLVDVGLWDRVRNFGVDFAVRSLGLAQAGGGILEMGVGGLLSTTGIGTVIGVPLGLHGADNYKAGIQTWQTGAFQPTLTEQMLNDRFVGAGIDPGIAGPAAIAADVLIGIANPGTAARHIGRETLEYATTTIVPPRKGETRDLAPGKTGTSHPRP